MSGRARSGVAAARSGWTRDDRELVGKHPFHGLFVRLRHLGLTGERGLAARRLLGEDVRMERMVPLQLPCSRLLEPLRGSTVRLHFRHDSPLVPKLGAKPA